MYIYIKTKSIEEKLDENFTRMQEAVLNKFWKPHSTKQQLYGHLTPISTTILDEQDMLHTARK